MSEVIYTESCHAGLLCMALNLGNSFGSSLLVGVCRIKLNNLTKYVELSIECLRTRVQFPPPPPILKVPTLIGWNFFARSPRENRNDVASVAPWTARFAARFLQIPLSVISRDASPRDANSTIFNYLQKKIRSVISPKSQKLKYNVI